MRNASGKSCRENKKHTFCIQYLVLENRAVYELMCKNIVERGRPRDNKAHAHCMLDT